MKRIIPILATLILAATTFSCKTTEENYRAAYEKAKEKQRAGLDSTIYDKIRREAKPETLVIGNDTIGIKREFVAVTKGFDTKASELRRFNVVAAQFKQLFHAKSMRSRLIEAGFPSTIIIETREPLYYVVALSTDIFQDAIDTMRVLSQRPPFRLQEDCPWILRTANR